ncbi:MAG: DNA polymerase [Patescibacteria group bacterium]
MHIQAKAKKLGIIIPEITSEEINSAIKPVLRKMEEAGIMIDCDRLKSLDDKLSERLKELEAEIYKLAGSEFNIGSPVQMAEVLFNQLKLPVDGLKRTKSGVSTAASELFKIKDEHQIIAPILEYRELSKLISTYLRPLPILVDENSRLHTTYGLETSTGRLTSSEPNLQNIPIRGKYGEEVRSTFVAAPGMKLIAADYSQIELRIVACLAKDEAMIQAFKEGIDIHTKTASEIFKVPVSKVTSDMRRKAKGVNFGIVYGQTPYGLSQSLGIDTEEAGKYIREYFDVHKGIKNYINEMIEMAHTEGYVETLFGTRRYLPEINSRNRYLAESEERMAINAPVQGTAAELLKLAMIEMDRKFQSDSLIVRQSDSQQNNLTMKLTDKKTKRPTDQSTIGPRMLLTVHDELVVEVPGKNAEEIAKIVEETMVSVVKFCVPIEVCIGIGDNWANAK